MFSQSSAKTLNYREQEVVEDLGGYWHIKVIRTKKNACVGGVHGFIKAIESLQHREPEKMVDLDSISLMNIRPSHPVYIHDGWKA